MSWRQIGDKTFPQPVFGTKPLPEPVLTSLFIHPHINELVQERRNSIANALELRLSCSNPSICATRLQWVQGQDNRTSINNIYIIISAHAHQRVNISTPTCHFGIKWSKMNAGALLWGTLIKACISVQPSLTIPSDSIWIHVLPVGINSQIITRNHYKRHPRLGAFCLISLCVCSVGFNWIFMMFILKFPCNLLSIMLGLALRLQGIMGRINSVNSDFIID